MSLIRVEDIPVIHYQAERIPDDRPGRPATATQFWRVREAIVAACQRHGPVYGEAPSDDEGAIYGVIDDQYNEERYQYVEVLKPQGVTKAWLLDLMQTLGEHSNWGVGVANIGEGYLLVFPDQLMVTGRTFRRSKTLDQVVRSAGRAMRLAEKVAQAKDDQGLEQLCRIPGIDSHALCLRDLDAVTDKGLRFVGRLRGTVDLVLSDVPITDRGLSHLRHLANLRTLYLWTTDIDGSGFRYLRKLAALQCLDVRGCRLSKEGFRRLGELKALEDLCLGETNLTDATAGCLQSLHQLKRLSLYKCRVGNRTLSYLAGLNNLQDLNLEGTRVTDAGVKHLERLTSLTSLWLRGTRVSKAVVKSLERKLPGCAIPEPGS